MPLPDSRSSLDRWSNALAQSTIAPAGGSAAAIAAAMGASLVVMVTGLTLERERYAEVHAEAARLRDAAERLRAELLDLARTDAQALAELSEALKLPANIENVRETRKRRAMAKGGEVQLDVARRAAEVAAMGDRMGRLVPPSMIGDAATATFLAASATRSAYWAVRNDLGNDSNGARAFLDQAEAAEQRVAALLAERIGTPTV